VVRSLERGKLRTSQSLSQLTLVPSSPRPFAVPNRTSAGAAAGRRLPATLPDRLFLVAASSVPELRPVLDALSRIKVYNLNPREIGAMQKSDPGDRLRRDGSNAASVLQQFSADIRQRVTVNLSRIVPGVSDAETKTLGSQETIEFRQSVKGQEHPWRFLAGDMSDGALRAFGILLAVFQAKAAREGRLPPSLIGLEEPEMPCIPQPQACCCPPSANVPNTVRSWSPATAPTCWTIRISRPNPSLQSTTRMD